MKKAILVHGWVNKKWYYNPDKPTSSNAHWFPWLSKQLMIRDIHTVAIEMPNSFYPEYPIWKKELERFELDEDTTIVAHSWGGGFIVRYISENNIKVGKVVLVAPWMGIDFEFNAPIDKSFFEFTLDKDLMDKTSGVTIIESTNDSNQIKKSVQMLKNNLRGAKIISLENRGHFCNPDGTGGSMVFPELLEEIIVD